MDSITLTQLSSHALLGRSPRVRDKSKPNMFSRFIKSGSNKTLVAQDIKTRVSLWLTCYRPPNDEVSLWLKFIDREGEKEYLIDTQSLNQGHSIMFSGDAKLKVMGEISDIELKCSGLENDIPFKVEEYELKVAA